MKHLPGVPRGAFTLFETLIALALSIVLMGATLSFLYNLGTRRAMLLERARAGRGAASLLERLEADLLCCCAGDFQAGSGINGEKSSLVVLTRGVSFERGASDLCQSRYAFQRETGTFTYSRDSLPTPSSAGVSPEPIASGIAEIVFRYFDGRNWRSAYDSVAMNRLPSAVEVTIWLGVPHGLSQDTDRPAPDFSRVIAIADADGGESEQRP